MNSDRNFDDIADHFEQKIYGGLKGQLRYAVIDRDLRCYVHPYISTPTDQVLDLGAGLGQFTIEFAKAEFHVTYNDLSENMTHKARARAKKYDLENKINWENASYTQLLTQKHQNRYSLVLCHALLEWLAKPKELLSELGNLVAKNGFVSLCAYNPSATIFHNLLRGNFDWVDHHMHGDSFVIEENRGGLTPMNPIALNDIENQFKTNGFQIVTSSGIRVFSDYVHLQSGGNAIEEEIFKKELLFSTVEPYKNMARYIHYIVQKI